MVTVMQSTHYVSQDMGGPSPTLKGQGFSRQNFYKIEELPILDLGDVKVKAKTANIHFEGLPNPKNVNNAVVAYARFVYLMNQGMLLNDALDQIVSEGYLLDFFGRKENRDMFADVFSYEQQLKDYGAQQAWMEAKEKILEAEKKAEAEQLESARRLLSRGVKIEHIAEDLNLDIEIISAIQNDLLL